MEKDLAVEEVVEVLEVVHEVVDPMEVQKVQEHSVDQRAIVAMEVIIV
jgi:hypothetical protein